MTIDKFASTLLETLVRIAVALEAIVTSQGIVAGTVPPQQELPLGSNDELEDDDLDDDDDDLDLEDDDLEDDDLEDDDPPPSTRKKRSKKKAAKKKTAKKKKKTAKKKRVGKKADPVSNYSADEVREQLKEVQLATGSAAEAKSILKANGASTFGQLQVGRYDEVVAACEKLLDEYE